MEEGIGPLRYPSNQNKDGGESGMEWYTGV